MIVIFVDNIENFVSFLSTRVMNEIFYEIKEIKSHNQDLSSEVDFEIILNFLSKVQEFLVLYETKVNLSKSESPKLENSENLIKELQKIFTKVDPSISLVKGKIREIYLSFSS